MCTVSWLFRPDGFDLLSNRDESRLRRPALPPRLWERDGVRFLAPEDAEAGGSWITVNERGAALCLLNLYGIEAPALPAGQTFTSRGLLVTSLAVAATAGEVVRRLRGEDLASYRPFTLLALDAGGGARACAWDGRALRDVDGPDADAPDGGASEGGAPAMPLISSGHDVAGATRLRRALLAERVSEAGGLSPELLYEFHRSHRPERGPYSPCMHRHDAKTVSFSWVRVRPEEISLTYAAGSPCTTPLDPPLTLVPALAAALRG